jgi:hypothetical protein
MDDLITHLKNLEERLFQPNVRRSRPELELLLSSDFREIGRSGRHYVFDEIVEALLNETDAGDVAKADHFQLQMLAEGVALLTYRSSRIGDDSNEVKTLRSSIWRVEEDGCWRMIFHQGTPAR